MLRQRLNSIRAIKSNPHYNIRGRDIFGKPSKLINELMIGISNRITLKLMRSQNYGN